MSVRQYPSEDSSSRQSRAEDCEILDIRTIDGEAFSVNQETVYEIDVRNENGELRENVVIIPRVLFESTKDVQYRHEEGIVGKYSRKLALEDEQAMDELLAGIDDKRDEFQSEVQTLKEKDARLLHTQADLNGL